jgi:membrane protein DedA with SNARE-associated domain
MIHAIALYGLGLLFANVLLTQLGFPVPAVPMLMAIGASAADGKFSALLVLVVAIAAAMIADSLWYVAGRTYGDRLQKLLCRLWPSAGSYIRQTEAYFERWGPLALVVAKFIPGFSTVASPLAGSARMNWFSFLVLDGLGSTLWAVSAVSIGIFFHAEIDVIVRRMEDLGAIAFLVAGVLAAEYVLYKGWQRLHLRSKLRVETVTVKEL